MLKQGLELIKDYGLTDKILSKISEKERKKEIGSKSYKLFIEESEWESQWVCFLPWGMKFDLAKKIGLIPKRGRCFVYEGPIGIPSPNPQDSKDLLLELSENVSSLGLNNFNIMGLSVGTYAGFFMANNFDVNKLVAVVPSSKLGAALWEGIATQEIRRRASKFGLENSLDYDEIISGTNSIENISNLPDDIEIHVATHDRYIPTKYGEELISEVQKQRNPKIQRYNGKGHVLTLLQFGQSNPY